MCFEAYVRFGAPPMTGTIYEHTTQRMERLMIISLQLAVVQSCIPVRSVGIVGGALTCPFTLSFAHKMSHLREWSAFWEPRMRAEIPLSKDVNLESVNVPSKVTCTVFVQSNPHSVKEIPDSDLIVIVGDNLRAARHLASLRSYKSSRLFRVPMTRAPFSTGRIPQCDNSALSDQVIHWIQKASSEEWKEL